MTPATPSSAVRLVPLPVGHHEGSCTACTKPAIADLQVGALGFAWCTRFCQQHLLELEHQVTMLSHALDDRRTRRPVRTRRRS